MIKGFGGKIPRIHESCFVAEGAVVIGDVEMDEDASVWFGCVVRADVHYIRIGARTNIQDGSILHVTKDRFPMELGDGVTVGHGVRLHGCTIAHRCLIGNGAIVLDGCEIGEESIVAAGALLLPGTKVPPRSLMVGSPAKLKRHLTEADMELIRRPAQNYVRLKNLYKAL